MQLQLGALEAQQPHATAGIRRNVNAVARGKRDACHLLVRGHPKKQSTRFLRARSRARTLPLVVGLRCARTLPLVVGCAARGRFEIKSVRAQRRPTKSALAILYETSQLIHDPDANYIVIATSLMASIWVLFLHLMRLFAFFSGED